MHTIKNILESKKQKEKLSFEWKKLLFLSIDEDTTASISSIPDAIIEDGIETMESLKESFERVEMEGIRVAYLPPNPTIWGFVLAEIFTLLTIRERDLDALGTASDDHSKLHRAACFIEQNNLCNSIQEIKTIQNENVRLLCNDWLRKACDRLTIDNHIEFLNTHVKAKQDTLKKIF